MTDGLISLTPLMATVTALVTHWGPWLVAMLGVYLGLFLVGLVVEAMRSNRAGNRSDG